MSRSLADLAKDLRAHSVGIAEKANNAARNVALEIVRDLANETPVDTSRALSNWQVGLGRPDSTSVLPWFPGMLGDTKTESAIATVDFAREVLTRKRPGQPIYITNNLTYIELLNEGRSIQAPAGFVETSIVRGTFIGLQNWERNLNV